MNYSTSCLFQKILWEVLLNKKIDITEDKQLIWGLAFRKWQSVFWNLWSMSVTGGLNHWDVHSHRPVILNQICRVQSQIFCLFTTIGKLLPKAAKLIFACFAWYLLHALILMVACSLRFILQSCHLLTTYDASQSSDFKLLCIKLTQLSSCKTTAYDHYLLVRRLTGLSWAVLIVALQRVAGWWWLGMVRLQTGWNQLANSFTHMPESGSGRIQLWADWWDSLSISPQMLGVADFSDVAQVFKAVWPERACRAWHFNHILVICGKLWEVSPSSGRGIVSTSRQEEDKEFRDMS